ncbi:S-layer homology domain-containing protein, partial [Agathobaculum sp. TL06]
HQKKVLALVLAFACAFTMFAGAAFTDEADIKATDAVNMLTALGVIEGNPDGSFKPDATVTRAEMAKMIFVVRNNTIDDSAYENNSSKMTDISSHWAKGYIKFCESQGIIAGYGDNTFRPDATVTGVEAAKMLLVLAGYDADKAGLVGHDWSTNTLRYAGSAGILDDVNAGLESGLPRQYAAQMIYNTLDTNRVKWSEDSKSFDDVLNGGIKETVGKAYMKLYSSVGTLISVDTDTLTLTGIDAAESDPISSSTNNGTVSYRYGEEFTKVGTDYSSLLGQKVKVMFKDGKTNSVMGVYPLSDNEVYTVVANGTEKDGDKVKFGGKSYSVELTNGGIKTYIDGALSDPTTLAQLDANALNPNMYTFVDADGNNKLDTLIVKTYNVAKVTYAASDKIIAGGKTYKFADENIDENIAKDDWVVITENLYNDNKDIVKADMATDKLSGLRDNNTNKSIYFDGGKIQTGKSYDEYKIGDDWYKGGEDLVQGSLSENDLNSVKAGENVEYVAVNGVMFYVKKASGTGTGRVADVAMVLAKDTTGVEDRAKIAFFDGTTDTVDVDTVYTDNNGTEGTLSNLTPGVVYEYSVSGDKYDFEPLKSGIQDEKYEEYYGDLTYRTESNGDELTTDDFGSAGLSAQGDLATFDGMKIDDDAQVLLYSSNDSKKITGKQFKAMAYTKVVSGKTVYAFSGDMNGLDRIGALAVEVDNFTGLVKTWSNYGYIVTKPTRIDSKTITYTVWTTNGNVEVQEEKSNINARAKGTVIGFDTLNEKDGVNVIDDVEALGASTSNTVTDDITFTAITDANSKSVQFAVKPVGGSSTELDVAGTILYIDSNADNDLDIGVEDGEIKDAQKIDGKYLANALVIGNGDDIELLIVDQGEYLKNDAYKADLATASNVIYGGDASAQSISDETFDNATVGTAYEVQKTLTAKNIADNKSAYVEITAGDNLGLNVKVSDVDDEKITVTVSGTPTKTGTLKFKVSADDATSDVMQVEVKDAAEVVGSVERVNVSGTATYGTISGDVTINALFKDAAVMTPTYKIYLKTDASETDLVGEANGFTNSDAFDMLSQDSEVGTAKFKTKATTPAGTYVVKISLDEDTYKTAEFTVAQLQPTLAVKTGETSGTTIKLTGATGITEDDLKNITVTATGTVGSNADTDLGVDDVTVSSGEITITITKTLDSSSPVKVTFAGTSANVIFPAEVTGTANA